MVIVRKLKLVSKWWPKCENNRGVAFALLLRRWKFIEINGLKREGGKARGNTSLNIFQDLYRKSMRIQYIVCVFDKNRSLTLWRKQSFKPFVFFPWLLFLFNGVYSKPNFPLCQPKYCFLPFDVGDSASNNVSHNSNNLIWINVFHLHFVQTI